MAKPLKLTEPQEILLSQLSSGCRVDQESLKLYNRRNVRHLMHRTVFNSLIQKKLLHIVDPDEGWVAKRRGI